jgi:lactoylglutathione lyase
MPVEAMKMFTEMFPILTTRDMRRSLAFYSDLLDAKVDYQFPPDGEPVYVGLRLASTHFGIGLDTGERPAQDAEGSRWIELWIYADDCDAAVERLRAAGVTIVDEPVDQPWGERVAKVEDPDGHRIYVATHAKPA